MLQFREIQGEGMVMARAQLFILHLLGSTTALTGSGHIPSAKPTAI